jgi:hypothetical protein
MYHYSDIPGTLSYGDTRELARIEAPGWFLGFAGHVSGSRDAKYVRVRVEMDGPEKVFPVELSPSDVFTFGWTMPHNFGAYVTRYDDSTMEYAGSITPSKPIPFTRSFVVKIMAPPSPKEEATPKPMNYRVIITVAKIVDVEEFRRSVWEILSPTVKLQEQPLRPPVARI